MPDTLYIADIDPLVDESQVLEAIGTSDSTVKLVRDPLGRGLAHAYVTLPDGAPLPQPPLFIGSTMCRVLKIEGNKFERPGKANGEGIFIKNLVPELTARELYEKFKKFGDIVTLRIALDQLGNSRGFAYATFTTKEAAIEAIAKMNGQEHWGRKLYVGLNLPRRERVYKYEESKPEFTNLFVKGIGQQTKEQDFFDFFTAIGPIDSYSMPIDEYGAPRGFGFVNYKNHDDAIKAVTMLNNTKLGDRVIHVSRAQQRDKPQKQLDTPNLYIRNLEPGVTDEALAHEFLKFGPIASAKVMMDEHGKSRGFGFVCFQDPVAAENAIKEMHGAQVWGNTLYVALAQRKGRPWFRQQVAPMVQYGMPPGVGGMPMYMPMMMPMPMYPYYGEVPQPQVPHQGQGLPQHQHQHQVGTAPVKLRRQQDYGSSIAAAVASAEDAQAEKEVIGEALYPKVSKHPSVDTDSLAQQITGILLEEAKDDLLVWVDHDEVLNKKIKQAVDAYEKYYGDKSDN